MLTMSEPLNYAGQILSKEFRSAQANGYQTEELGSRDLASRKVRAWVVGSRRAVT
jgi:hypothetical protein